MSVRTHEESTQAAAREPWPAIAPPRPAPLRAAIARRLLRRAANQSGIQVVMPDGSTFGPSGGPRLVVQNTRSFFTRLGRDGKIGFGEAFMAGDWDSPQLVAMLTALAAHATTLVPTSLQHLRRLYEEHRPSNEDNDHLGAKRNIARHYDLSNELFATFLDDSMTYSSALFETPDDSLEKAQARKVERILDIAGVGVGTRVLEIGTGWGELTLRAAERGASVTSLTLSLEQARLARQRVEEAGFSGVVDIRVEDYRDVSGKYDAIVSIEMIEAVGERWWPSFFRQLDRLLEPNGRVGLQAILMDHSRLLATRSSWTWVHKYIFPGGLVPSKQAIDEALEQHTTLAVVQDLRFGASYAETLVRWRRTFESRSSLIEALGFDETFRRMWSFYLAYSEAGFRSGYLDVSQLVLDRHVREDDVSPPREDSR